MEYASGRRKFGTDMRKEQDAQRCKAIYFQIVQMRYVLSSLGSPYKVRIKIY